MKLILVIVLIFGFLFGTFISDGAEILMYKEKEMTQEEAWDNIQILDLKRKLEYILTSSKIKSLKDKVIIIRNGDSIHAVSVGEIKKKQGTYKYEENDDFGGSKKEKSNVYYEELGNLERAQKNEKKGDFFWAARYYEWAGEAEKAAECYKTSAEKAVEEGSFDKAAKEYEHMGDTEKAKKYWEKAAEKEIRECREEKEWENLWYVSIYYRNAGLMDKYKEVMELIKENQ